MNSLSSASMAKPPASSPSQPNRPVKKDHSISPKQTKKRSINKKGKTAASPPIIRIKAPSLRKEKVNNSNTKDLKNKNNNNDTTITEAISENSSSHRKPIGTRFKRWNFGGSQTEEDDAEYGGDLGSIDSFDDSFHCGGGGNSSHKKPRSRDSVFSSSTNKSRVEVANDSDDNNSDSWDSDIAMGDGPGGGNAALLPPNRKGQQHQALFPDDKWWQSCLRYFRVLPPHPNEGRTRRIVRRLIWATLIFDCLVAIVTIATYSGTVTMCCNQVTMASIPTIDWNTFIKVVSYIYLVGIFLEIHPVVREGPIPWNLLNPIFGSLLSFAVFVDDSKAEAIGIWILEITSVVLEGITYRKLKTLYQREERRLKKVDSFLKSDQSSSNQHRKGGQYKKNAYLRERRILRIEHAQNKSKLRYHFVGVTVNFVLVGLTLLLMVLVARGRGMCLVAGEGLDLFHPDQRSRCFECLDKSDGWNKRCEVCEDGPHEDVTLNDPIQCFYPYF